MHTETKQEQDEGARACHVLMTSQRTKEGGMGIYNRGFLGIIREAQLGITLGAHKEKKKKVKTGVCS